MAKLAFNSKFSESHFSKNLDVFVGLSGGADSIALLHYLNEMNKSNEIGSLKAIHVNHGYSPESKKWENFCKDFCNNHNIEFTATSIPNLDSTASLEGSFRKARFKIFANIIRTPGVLALGHHMNDQVETILFRMFRGSGPEGISGINEVSIVDEVKVLRPMLKIEKDEIYEYVEKHNLEYIHDHSNDDEQFDRNFIRSKLIPLISERWPAAIKKISDLSELSQQDIEFKNIFLEQRIEEFRSESGLNISSLSKLSEIERTYIIRHWIKKNGFSQPNRKTQLEIEKIFFCSQTTSNSSVQWSRADNAQKSCKMFTDKKSLIIKEP